MNDSNFNAYAASIRRVVEYIEAHLTSDLSVERLSQVAGFSKYHFHRQFTAHTGLTVGKLTRQLRLKRATWELAFSPEKKVIEIALGAGFTNPETFARAFKAVQGQSPTEFRKAPKWREWEILTEAKQGKPIDMNPEIVSFQTTPIAVLEHRAPPSKVMDSVSLFTNWRSRSKASPENQSRTFGIIYDDPDSTKAEDFRFDLCGELKATIEKNTEGITEKEIPGGRCVKITHQGSLDNIGESVRALYANWLPKSGETLRDFPCFFEYRKRMPLVSEHEQETDIYIPLNS